MDELKARITSWSTTVPGVALLAVLGWFVYLDRSLLAKPEALLALAGGLAAIFMRSGGSSGTK